MPCKYCDTMVVGRLYELSSDKNACPDCGTNIPIDGAVGYYSGLIYTEDNNPGQVLEKPLHRWMIPAGRVSCPGCGYRVTGLTKDCGYEGRG